MPKKVAATTKKQTNKVCTYIVAATIGFSLLGTINYTKAEIVNTDAWHGKDKAEHFTVSMGLGMIGASFFSGAQSPANQFLYGTLIGSMPGLIKEIRDIHHHGSNASYKDMTFNVLGAATGAAIATLMNSFTDTHQTKWTIIPTSTKNQMNGVVFQYRTEF
jgi:putative lipoprotein